MITRSLEQKPSDILLIRAREGRILRNVEEPELLLTLYKSPRDADELDITLSSALRS